MHKNLGGFLSSLKDSGELYEISTEVDSNLEIAEIHRRVIAANGPALLFKNVKDKNFPVVTNMFGTRERVYKAFGTDPIKFIETTAKLPHELMPPKISKLWQHRDYFMKAARIGYSYTKKGAVAECEIPGANLGSLPALTSWPEDGGAFLTLPLVHTQGAGPKPDNLGMYRVQIFSDSEAGMHFQIHKGSGFHLRAAEEQNQPLNSNIYLGGPPALVLSAIAPLPENVPELLLASLLQGKKLSKTKVLGYSLDPISECEFAILGSIPPHIRRPEGPFGDHYGYYSLVHDYPVFRPSKIIHRKNAIFPATIVGKPRQEDFYIGDFLQDLLSPLFPVVMPAVRDLWSYGETGYHALTSACFYERYPREAMSSVFRVLGEGQLSLTKFLLAIDKPMDLKDFRKVLIYTLERVDWTKDLYVFSQLSMDSLDYSGPKVNKGSKGVLLGMGEPIRHLPYELKGVHKSSLIKNLKVFCPGCLVAEIPAYVDDSESVKEIASIEELKDWPLIIAVDNAEKATKSVSSFLWTCFTRFEPAGDIHPKSTQVKRHHLEYEGPIVIDARMKPWYPKELFCDERTAKIVDMRWSEYFPCGKVEMGSSDEANLYE